MIICTGVGRLTRDPETRTTTSGKTVATLRVASDGRGRNADPTFVDLEVWDTLASTCAEYLSKGRQIAFTGSLRYSEWVKDDGEKRSRHTITAHQIEFLAAPKTETTEQDPEAGAAADIAF